MGQKKERQNADGPVAKQHPWPERQPSDQNHGYLNREKGKRNREMGGKGMETRPGDI